MPTQITSAGITFTDTTTLTSANGVPSALKLTTARTINGVAFDGTGNITIPATSISGANVAKAWVNFNGTTSPGTIRSSYNVSSVTKNGTGDYTINFSTPMADANYSISACGEGTSSTNVGNVSKRASVDFTTSAARILCGDNGTSAAVPRDASVVCFQVFGN